jgi:adenosine deaminase
MSQEQKAVTFPYIQIQVGQNRIVLETFFSPNVSIKQGISEEQVNEMLKVWLQNRKQLQAQQQLVHDVMKKLH